MKIEKFEDLICWQLSRELSKMIYGFIKKPNFSRDFELVGQMRDSSGSVMDNIAEGFERGGNKEFINFLFISKASNAELRSQLYRAIDNNYINQSDFKTAYDLSINVRKNLIKLIESLKGRPNNGMKNW